MHRRCYCPPFKLCRQNAAAETYSDRSKSNQIAYRKHVDPAAHDHDGRNAVHMSVLSAMHDPLVNSSIATEIALEQVIHFQFSVCKLSLKCYVALCN